MAEFITGVNHSSEVFEGNGGKNRIRFETVSQRLQKLSVDIVHKVPPRQLVDTSSATSYAAVNDLGGSSYFSSELEVLKQLATSSHFTYFYRKVHGLVQTLPELLHNLGKVVDMLIFYISCKKSEDAIECSIPQPSELGLYLTLLSTLTRYSLLSIG